MDNFITKRLLFDHFAGRLTPLQQSQIAEWLQQPAHHELYYEWLEEWERHNLQYAADPETALHQALLFIDQQGQTQPEPAIRRLTVGQNWLPGGNWMAVAATIVACLAAGLYGSRSYWLFKTVETAFGEVRRVALDDGSVVTLNANSTLRYARFGFGSHTRHVQFRGEALFSVTHTTTDQPFVVETPNGPEVMVLGTQFTVFARPRGLKVALNQGQIRLRYQAENPNQQARRQVLMKPGDLITMSPKGRVQYKRSKQQPLGPAWLKHRFVFDETPLLEVAAVFADEFGVQIEIADSVLAHETVTGSFTAYSADELLEILAERANLRYQKTVTQVVLLTQMP